MQFTKSLLYIFILLFLCFECKPKQSEKTDYGVEIESHVRKQKKNHRNNRQSYRNDNRQNQSSSQNETTTTNIPQKVREVLAYVRSNKQAMDGYVGGRRFKNLENHLDKQTASGQKIEYQEWDVNPKEQGRNRGTERLITGSDGRAWFTSDHYRSFVEVR